MLFWIMLFWVMAIAPVIEWNVPPLRAWVIRARRASIRCRHSEAAAYREGVAIRVDLSAKPAIRGADTFGYRGDAPTARARGGHWWRQRDGASSKPTSIRQLEERNAAHHRR
jgi:hypothetical protein